MAAGRSRVTRAASAGPMLRSPISTSRGLSRTARTSGRSCTTFHPGRNDRWVQATVSGPNGEATSATTATRGSSATRCGVRWPAEPVRRAAGQGGQPQHPPAGHRVAGEQGDAVRRGAERFVTGGRRPGLARGAGQGRDEPVVDGTHRLGRDRRQVGVPRADLPAVDLLQGEDVGVQLAHDGREPVRVHPVVGW